VYIVYAIYSVYSRSEYKRVSTTEVGLAMVVELKQTIRTTYFLQICLLSSIVLCLLSSAVYSQSVLHPTVASVDIQISQQGFVSIDGTTNRPELLTDATANYTTKKGDVWTFNLSDSTVYSSLTYRISLPPNTIVTYIKGPNAYIASDRTIQGFATNMSLSLVVQYKFELPQSFEVPFIWIISGVFVFVILSLVSYLNYVRSRRLFLERLSKSQQTLMSYIIQKNGITQKELEQKTNFPKASLSRNLKQLSQKNYVDIVAVGMTNKIFYKKKW
jgi:uncharacterized membrane protein